MDSKCLIFSMWVPQQSIKLGYYYLDMIESIFNSEDVYIGINIGTDETFITEVLRRFKNVKLVDQELYLNSDASGYQAALSMLDKEYEFVVFGHSKGASYQSVEQSFEYRELMKNIFWGNLDYIFNTLKSNDTYGIAGYTLINDGHGCPDYDNIMKEFYDFKYKPTMAFYAGTFYVMKGFILNEFLKKQINFLTSNLKNRYFFESHFPKIVSMMGYKMVSLIYDPKLGFNKKIFVL